MASVRAELRELVDQIRAEGFQCAIERDGHWHVYRHGKPVFRKSGGAPVTLPGSPSDHRWRDNVIPMLVDARIFTEDPRKRDQIALAKRDPELRQLRDEMASKIQAAPKKEPPGPRQLSPRNAAVRSALIDALEQLGSSKAEFVRLVQKVGASRGMRMFRTENAGSVAIGNLVNHSTPVSAWVLDLLEATLAEIGATPNDDRPDGATAPPPAPPVPAGPVDLEENIEEVTTTATPEVEEIVAEKKKRAAPAPDPRIADLRRRMKALMPKHMNTADFVRIVMAAGRKQRGMRLFANEQAGQVGVRRILKGGGGQRWVVDLLEVGVPAAEEKVRGPQQTIDAPKPTEAEVLAGMRDLGKPLEDAYTENAAVEAPEVVPTHWTAEERKHLVSDAEFTPAANGSNGHRVTADDLRELVIIARAHALLRAADDGTIPETDDLGKLIEKKIEQLTAV